MNGSRTNAMAPGRWREFDEEERALVGNSLSPQGEPVSIGPKKGEVVLLNEIVGFRRQTGANAVGR